MPLACVGEEDHTGHDHEAEALDTHIWTSPRNAITLCQTISQEMQQLDSQNSALYAANCQEYVRQLEQLQAEFETVMDQAQRTSILFADRMPFRYLAEDLGLTCYAAFQGCSADTEPSLATIAFLTQVIEREQLPVVFCLENSDPTVADTLCQATGRAEACSSTPATT